MVSRLAQKQVAWYNFKKNYIYKKTPILYRYSGGKHAIHNVHYKHTRTRFQRVFIETPTAAAESNRCGVPTTPVTWTDTPKDIDPMKKTLIIFPIVLIFLIVIVVISSNLNAKKYFMRASAGALEVWQGTFSPAGKKRLVSMPGVSPPEVTKPSYSRDEVYPLIFSYYIDKADALIDMPGLPDFVGIKFYLNRAMSFATTDDQRKTVQARLNNMDRKILFYKADVAASKGSVAGLEAAMDYLNRASKLNPDEIERELIEKKKNAIRELIIAH
jgi:hypothetical protein